jgi:hypothetical protein
MHKLLRFAYELQAHLPETNKVVLDAGGKRVEASSRTQ